MQDLLQDCCESQPETSLFCRFFCINILCLLLSRDVNVLVIRSCSSSRPASDLPISVPLSPLTRLQRSRSGPGLWATRNLRTLAAEEMTVQISAAQSAQFRDCRPRGHSSWTPGSTGALAHRGKAPRGPCLWFWVMGFELGGWGGG